MNKYYTEEHKKLCDEMTKRYGAGWDKDKRAKNKIRDAAKQSARNLDNALRIGAMFNIPAKENLETKAKEEPYCKVVHLPEQEGKVKEGKKTAEVFVN